MTFFLIVVIGHLGDVVFWTLAVSVLFLFLAARSCYILLESCWVLVLTLIFGVAGVKSFFYPFYFSFFDGCPESFLVSYIENDPGANSKAF